MVRTGRRAGAAPKPGAGAPAFALHDSPHSRVMLEDLRGRAVVLVFYVADWHPVALAQLQLYQALLPHLERLNAVVVGISVDGTWSHQEFARTHGIAFALLSDDGPPGEVARAYGVYVSESGRSHRALFVIDPEGVVRWSATFPDALDPGADGVLSALEALRPAGLAVARDGANGVCSCGCGLSTALVGDRLHA